METFKDKLNTKRLDLRKSWKHYEVVDFNAGARCCLELIADEHKRYLDKKEKRSEIGPLFDAGLNTAAGAITASCLERIRELLDE